MQANIRVRQGRKKAGVEQNSKESWADYKAMRRLLQDGWVFSCCIGWGYK
ncbi:hypothetical protein AOR02nite_09900 [Acetobacter orientalis]|nr:hypothetical protein AOR02nite_09900 [Acetobacter orientalis]